MTKYAVIVPRVCNDGWVEWQRLATFFTRHEAAAACDALQPFFRGRVQYEVKREKADESEANALNDSP